MTEDEMAGWHHRLDGRESEGTPGVGDGQGGLACCDSWGLKESDTTENRTPGPPLENNPEIPPSSREEGLRLLHGLATNLATSLQTPQEA